MRQESPNESGGRLTSLIVNANTVCIILGLHRRTALGTLIRGEMGLRFSEPDDNDTRK